MNLLSFSSTLNHQGFHICNCFFPTFKERFSNNGVPDIELRELSNGSNWDHITFVQTMACIDSQANTFSKLGCFSNALELLLLLITSQICVAASM